MLLSLAPGVYLLRESIGIENVGWSTRYSRSIDELLDSGNAVDGAAFLRNGGGRTLPTKSCGVDVG